jgi:hypothetical protein
VNEQQLTEINNQLNNARARTAEARARYEQIEMLQRSGGEPGAIPEAVQSQTIGQMRVQYAEAVRQRADLGAQLGSRHPSIIALESQVRDLRALIKDERTRITQSARSDLERGANEQSLEHSLDSLKRTAVSTNQAFVRLRELEREVETGGPCTRPPGPRAGNERADDRYHQCRVSSPRRPNRGTRAGLLARCWRRWRSSRASALARAPASCRSISTTPSVRAGNCRS